MTGNDMSGQAPAVRATAQDNAQQDSYGRYAEELNARFEELVQWAIANWPRANAPLMPSDFDAARRAIAQIGGAMLGEATPADQVPDPPGLAPERKPGYRDLNPMPWP